MNSKREKAAEAYVQSLRTGEFPAVDNAGRYLADDVVLKGAPVFGRQATEIRGKKEVLYRITGQWPNTPVYVKGFFSAPKEEGEKLKISATFPAMGAAPAAMNLTFAFNAQDLINEIEQEIVPQARPEPTDTIPDAARGLINSALMNDTPICVAYVDEDGVPNLSLRGSTQVYSPTQLSIWVRQKGGGMSKALAKNPSMGLLYRDSKTRSTLVVKGKGRIEEDPEIVAKVWNSIQDVEQKHETRESGCALIIDVESLTGGTPKGGVRMERSR